MFEIDKNSVIVSGRGYKFYPVVGEPGRRARRLEYGVHPLLKRQGRFDAACDLQQKARQEGIPGVAPIHARQSDGLNVVYTTDAYATDVGDLLRRKGRPIDGPTLGALLLDVADTLLALKTKFGRTHGLLAPSRLLLRTDDLRQLALAGDVARPDLTEFEPDPPPEEDTGGSAAPLAPCEEKDLTAFGEIIIRIGEGLAETKDAVAGLIPGEGADDAKRWTQFAAQRAAWIKLARGLLTPRPYLDPPTLEALRERLLPLASRPAVQRSQRREQQRQEQARRVEEPEALPDERDRTPEDQHPAARHAQLAAEHERQRREQEEQEEQERLAREAAERERQRQAEATQREQEERQRRTQQAAEQAAREEAERTRQRREQEEQERRVREAARRQAEAERAAREAAEREQQRQAAAAAQARRDAEREVRRHEREERRRAHLARLAGLPWGWILGVIGLVLGLTAAGIGYWKHKNHPGQLALDDATAQMSQGQWHRAWSSLNTAVDKAESRTQVRKAAEGLLRNLTNFPGFGPVAVTNRFRREGNAARLTFYTNETDGVAPYRIPFEVREEEARLPGSGRVWRIDSEEGDASPLQITRSDKGTNQFSLAWTKATSGVANLRFQVEGFTNATHTTRLQVDVTNSPPVTLTTDPFGVLPREVGSAVEVTAKVRDDPLYRGQRATVSWEVAGPAGLTATGQTTNAKWDLKQKGVYTNTWTVTDGAGRRESSTVIVTAVPSPADQKKEALDQLARLLESDALAAARELLRTNSAFATNRATLTNALAASPKLKRPTGIKVARAGRASREVQLDLPAELGALRWTLPERKLSSQGVGLSSATNRIVSSNAFALTVDATEATNAGTRNFSLPLTNGLAPNSALQISVTVEDNPALQRLEQALKDFEDRKYADAHKALTNFTEAQRDSLPGSSRKQRDDRLLAFGQKPRLRQTSIELPVGETLDLANWTRTNVVDLPGFDGWTLTFVEGGAPSGTTMLVNWTGVSNRTVRIASRLTPTNDVVVTVTGQESAAAKEAARLLKLLDDPGGTVAATDLVNLAGLSGVPTNRFVPEIARGLARFLRAIPVEFKLAPKAPGTARLEADPPDPARLGLQVANWPTNWQAKPSWELLADPSWPEGLKLDSDHTGLIYSPDPSETGGKSKVSVAGWVAGRKTAALELELLVKSNRKPQIEVTSTNAFFAATYTLTFRAWDPDEPSTRLREVTYATAKQAATRIEPTTDSPTNYSQDLALDPGVNRITLTAKDKAWTNTLGFEVTFQRPPPLEGILDLVWIDSPNGRPGEAGVWSGTKGFWAGRNWVTQADLDRFQKALGVPLPTAGFKRQDDSPSSPVLVAAEGADTNLRMHAAASAYLEAVQAAAKDLGGWRLTLGSYDQHLATDAKLKQSRPAEAFLLTTKPMCLFARGEERLSEFNYLRDGTTDYPKAVIRIFLSPSP